MTPDRWKQIKAIVEDAVEIEPHSRAAFLDARCSRDTTLRSEVESLLDHDNTGSDGLEGDAFSVVVGKPRPAAPSFEGTRLGNYEIVSRLGSGGMGAVFLAKRIDGLFEQNVAVKLIKRGMDSDAIIGRFVNERKILASLEHPNIARLIDGGTTEDGLPYFVMENVEGVPINTFVKEKQSSVDERLKLFLSVCDAVTYAHRRQIVHRDLKPSNILVSDDGTPKLLDFGIAKLLDANDETQATITETMWRLMTPEYASPEQARGIAVDHSSDIYSLGVVLFEILTGQRPYKFESRMPNEVARVICEEQPALPSTAARRPTSLSQADTSGTNAPTTGDKLISTNDLPRRLRGDLDKIVLMALNKAKEKRYASVEQFADDIRRHIEGRPINARKPKLADRWAGFLRRKVFPRLTPIVTLFLLLFVAVAASITAYWISNFTGNRTPIRSIAVLPFKYTGEGDPYIGPGLAEAIIAKLGRSGSLDVRPLRAVQQYVGSAAQNPVLIGQTLDVDAVVDGAIEPVGDTYSITVKLFSVKDGSLLWTQNFSEKAQNVATAQTMISEKLAYQLEIVKDPAELTAARNAKAYDAFLKGRYQWNLRTPEGYEKAIGFFEQAIAIDPDYAEAYAGLADAYALLACVVEFFDRRPERMQKAKENAMKAIELNGKLAEPYATLGFIGWHFEWDWEGSDRAFRRSIELNPSYATAHHWYAFLLVRVGRMDDAINEIVRARSLDPLSPIINQDVAELLFYARRYEETITAGRRAIEISPSAAFSNWFIAGSLGHLGRNQELLDHVKEIAKTDRTSFALNTLVETYLEQGMKAEAQKIFSELKTHTDFPNAGDMDRFYSLDEKKKRLIGWLKTEFEARGAGITRIHNHPDFDPFRADPAIQDYIQKMGLSQWALPKS